MTGVQVFIIDEAEEEFNKLNEIVGKQKAKGAKNSDEMQLLNSIQKKSELLKANPDYGDKIPRDCWPKKLVEKYGLTNLWRVELTNYWRMIYTLRGDKIEVVCFVINLLDHKKYDKLFGYKKK
ncbi:MAG: hypothetical protein WC607_04625 [Candidatus Micrarchaeia archaeon]